MQFVSTSIIFTGDCWCGLDKEAKCWEMCCYSAAAAAAVVAVAVVVVVAAAAAAGAAGCSVSEYFILALSGISGVHDTSLRLSD